MSNTKFDSLRADDFDAMATYQSSLTSVTKEDANNYCRILTVLGMEEEGDPVVEVEKLLAAYRVAQEPATPQDTKMWAVLIAGPDDLHAAPDRRTADAVALVMNHQFQRHPAYHSPQGVELRAEVIEWPYNYENWCIDKDLLRLEIVDT